MISIVLYGRNDNYGYNLHKRAALSFNCMAEVLTDPADEILFVDYNTPDDNPTFPEAIADTLTPRARQLLRIFRVRPSIHDRYKSKTRLKALEPIARNVAVRRSNSASKWILSTNTDMIFVPLRGDSLTDLTLELAPGFYHAPRIEIPEALWESFDRSEPVGIIRTVREWGSTLHLNEIVLGAETIRYDGPGDFQLLLRSDLFDCCGFDEAMLLGWHVDSNIAKRLRLKYGAVGDLGGAVYGYHCDHTRQVTPAHSHTRVQNDWRLFIEAVDRIGLPEQEQTWGCAGDTIEEIRLSSSTPGGYGKTLQALRRLNGNSNGPEQSPSASDHVRQRAALFLADLFASAPPLTSVAWYGSQAELLGAFATVWQQLDFSGKIITDRPVAASIGPMSSVRCVPAPNVLSEAGAFIFDFGGWPYDDLDPSQRSARARQLLRDFFRVVRAERTRLSCGLSLRRIIAVDAANGPLETLLSRFIAGSAGPLGTNMRLGLVAPPKSEARS